MLSILDQSQGAIRSGVSKIISPFQITSLLFNKQNGFWEIKKHRYDEQSRYVFMMQALGLSLEGVEDLNEMRIRVRAVLNQAGKTSSWSAGQVRNLKEYLQNTGGYSSVSPKYDGYGGRTLLQVTLIAGASSSSFSGGTPNDKLHEDVPGERGTAFLCRGMFKGTEDLRVEDQAAEGRGKLPFS